jgi:hypothetical protein
VTIAAIPNAPAALDAPVGPLGLALHGIPEGLNWQTAWSGHKDRVRQLIVEHGPQRVCEIGGGRSPLFSPEEVAALGVTEYTIVDISAEELALAPAGYETVCGDICDRDLLPSGGRFDLMFSQMVVEHVADGDLMHRNVLSLLAPGGIAFHFMPTLHYPAFAVNGVLPAWLTGWALRRFADRETPKFPAHYSRCFGPTPAMRAYLVGVGYEVVEHRPFYGSIYFERIPGVRSVERAMSRWAARRRSPRLSSFAYLVLRKPS